MYKNYTTMTIAVNIINYFQNSNYFNNSDYIYLNYIPKFKIIDLTNNGIAKNSKIPKVFCEALQINQNITQIDLNNNVFSEVNLLKHLKLR